MSQPSQGPTPQDDLQFVTAEAGGPNSPTVAGQQCFACQEPIESVYYALAEHIVCPSCHAQLVAPPAGSRFGRLFKATCLGVLAGLVGAAIWFAIRRLFHFELGLVAILVGFLVAKGVRRGAMGQGGRGYQVLAVLITYCCIAINYMPDVIEAVLDLANKENGPAAAANKDGAPAAAEAAPAAELEPAVEPVPAEAPKPPRGPVQTVARMALTGVLFLALSLAMPILTGIQNPIGLLILGFALWEAWKLTAKQHLPFSGPYRLGASPAV